MPHLHTSIIGYVIRIISNAILPFQFNKLVNEENQTNGESAQEFSVLCNAIGSTNTPLFSGKSIDNEFIVDLQNTSSQHY